MPKEVIREQRFAERVLLGIFLLLGIFAMGVILQGCDTSRETTGPTPTTSTAPVAAAAPAPAPTATPTAVDPTQPATFDLAFSAGACFEVKNNGQVPAGLSSWYSGFDDQNAVIDFRAQAVNPGGTWGRCFNKGCIQVDVDQPGVKLIGGGFFDKDQKPFIPSRNPEKVTECRTVPCTEKWEEIEDEPKITYGDWSACTFDEALDDSTSESGNGQTCSKKRTVTIVYRERNTCTKAEREGRTVKREESTPCECPCIERGIEGVKDYASAVWSGKIEQGACVFGPPQLTIASFGVTTVTPATCHENGTQAWVTDFTCKDDVRGTLDVCRSVTCPTPPPCVAPAVGTKLTQLSGGPDAECAAFGNYESDEKQEDWPWTFNLPYAFLICKAGTDHIVEPVGTFDVTCSNGKSISHVTACVCKD